MHEVLKYEQEDRVVVLTMNEPATRNALSGEKNFAAFEKAVNRINEDFGVSVAVLTGEGTAFCSGGNIVEMKERRGMFGGPQHQIPFRYAAGIQRVFRALYRLDVPLVAAVNGPAIGAGCDLACICDIRIASEKAVFAESFVRLGIVPGSGGAWLLQRAVGYSRAAEMAFTGDSWDAKTAQKIGLVSKVVPAEELMKETKALAARIATNPAHAVRWTKRLLREARHSSFDSNLELAACFQALAHQTADHAEAVAAVFEKRPPRFSGR